MERDDIRREAERRYHDYATEGARTRIPDDPAAVIEELRVHQIELEIQNEELRATQHELEASRERYFELYELAPVGYLTVTPDGAVREANLRACAMARRDRASVKRIGLLSLFTPEYHAALRRTLRAAADAPGEPITAEMALAGEVATPVHVEATASSAGEVQPEVRLCLTDVSRERAAEERARAVAERNELLRRELSHRTKNNFQLLHAIVTLQRRQATSDEAAQALASVEERVRAVAASHDALRGGENGVDLVGLATALLRPFSQDGPGDVTLVTELDSLVVSRDAALSLALVMNELVSNALKHAYSESGGAEVVVRLAGEGPGAGDEPGGESGTHVRLVVSDSGPGLPAEFLSDTEPAAGNHRVGQPDESASRAGEGDGGLGLSLVHQLVEGQLHGSWVRRNHPDGGAEHVVDAVV